MFVVGGIGAVQRPTVDDPLRADDARVADVDDVRVGHVEPDAEAEQEDDTEREPARGDEQAQRRLGSPR